MFLQDVVDLSVVCCVVIPFVLVESLVGVLVGEEGEASSEGYDGWILAVFPVLVLLLVVGWYGGIFGLG